MEKNKLVRKQGTIYRILAVEGDSILLIDCIKRTMPVWKEADWIKGCEECTEEELIEETGVILADEQAMSPKERKSVHERFTAIAGILPFLDDDRLRTERIKRIAEERKICAKTMRNYLCQYLAYQSLSALVPKGRTVPERGLTKDEKNIRCVSLSSAGQRKNLTRSCRKCLMQCQMREYGKRRYFI